MPFLQADDTSTCNPTLYKALAHCEHVQKVFDIDDYCIDGNDDSFPGTGKKYSQRYQYIMQTLSSHISKKTEMLSFSYSIIRPITFLAHDRCSTNS